MPSNRPNILMIMTDQQRFDMIAAHINAFDAETPGMDSLSRRGVTFENAFCTSPICSPSRAAIFTGLYPSRNGVFANLGNPCSPLSEDTVTIGDRLQEAGYLTAYHGKSHLGGDLSHYGFEIAYENGHDPSTLTEACRFYRNMDWVVAKRPFFHVVSFLNPHDLYFLDPDQEQAPELPPWPSASDDLSDKPWPQKLKHEPGWSPARWEYYRRFYASKVEKVDRQIVELIDELFCSGYGPNTWIIFTADHGDMAGEHSLTFKGPFMYDGVMRVPLIIVPPRAGMLGATSQDTPGGSSDFTPFKSPVLSSNVDLLPTIMDIAGLEVDENLPGKSLLPVIRGQADELHEEIFGEWHCFGKWTTPVRMIRTKKFKYNLYREIGEELYDLSSDPHEMNNLADSPACADVKKDLRKRLIAFIERTGDPFFSYSATKEG